MAKWLVPDGMGEAMARRMLYLAWQRSRCVGMGVWQQREGEQTEEQVWESMYRADDYQGRDFGTNKPGRVYADYVQGRMMKLGLEWGPGHVQLADTPWHAEYQSFCRAYPDQSLLVREAALSLGIAADVRLEAAL